MWIIRLAICGLPNSFHLTGLFPQPGETKTLGFLFSGAIERVSGMKRAEFQTLKFFDKL